MGVVAEATIELDEMLVDEGVALEFALESDLFGAVGELAMEEEEGGIVKVALRGQFFDGVAVE